MGITMRGKRDKKERKADNRGASLMIVMAAFVLLLTAAMNILMLTSSGNRTAIREYEAEQVSLYLSSIYGILNEKMTGGEWQEAFVPGETVEIEVSGFHDKEGGAIPVTITVAPNGNLADVSYLIQIQGNQYLILAQYQYSKSDGVFAITLKNCREIIQVK